MQKIKMILITCLCAASATLISACNSGGSGASAAATPNGNKNYSLSMPALSVFTDEMSISQVINIGGTPGNVHYTCNMSGFHEQQYLGSCNSISDSNRKAATQIYYNGWSGGAAMYTGAQINLPPSPFSDGSASFQPQLVALGGSLYSASSFVAMGSTSTVSSLYFGAVCDSPGNTCRTNTVAGYLAMPDGVYVPIALISQAAGKGKNAYNELYLIGDMTYGNPNYTCGNSHNGIDCTTYLNHRFHISLSRQNNLLGTLSIDNLDNAALNSSSQSFLQMNQIFGSYNQTCYNSFITINSSMGNGVGPAQNAVANLNAFCSVYDTGNISANIAWLTFLGSPDYFINNGGVLTQNN